MKVFLWTLLLPFTETTIHVDEIILGFLVDNYQFSLDLHTIRFSFDFRIIHRK